MNPVRLDGVFTDTDVEFFVFGKSALAAHDASVLREAANIVTDLASGQENYTIIDGLRLSVAELRARADALEGGISLSGSPYQRHPARV